MKRKIAVLIINRANYGRLKPVLRAIEEHPDLELQLIVGSAMTLYRFGNDIDYIERDGFNISARFNMIVEGGTPTTMAQSAGLGLMNLPTILEQLKPDIFLVNADRFEILPAATAAAYMNIPIAHTLGGEITGTIDESVRHAVTKLAHIHFTAHRKAALRIIKMGEDPESVFVVGNPSLDIAKTIPDKIDTLKFWDKYGGTGAPIDFSKPYLLVYQHPVTTEHENAFSQMSNTLEALRQIGKQTIAIWPNPDAGTEGTSKAIRVFKEKFPTAPIHFFRSFANEDYLALLKNAACIVGNSSSAIMEGGFFGTPTVNIGTRQGSRERCKNSVDVGNAIEKIKKAILKQLDQERFEPDLTFGDGNSSKRIANILAKHQIKNVQKKFKETLKESNEYIKFKNDNILI